MAYGKIDGSLMEEGERGINEHGDDTVESKTCQGRGRRGVNEHGDDTVESKKHVNQVLSSEDNRALPDTMERQTGTNEKSLTDQTTSHSRFAVAPSDAVVITSIGTAKHMPTAIRAHECISRCCSRTFTRCYLFEQSRP